MIPKALYLIALLFLSLLRIDAAERKPNVVLIVSDDQGWGDLGCYGANDLITPNLDALARSGTRFTQFYAAAPVCSPSRAAILTGRYPQRTGLVGNAASQREKPGGLASTEVTLAEMFKAAGYTTGHFGKWHLGYTPDAMPNAQGFDYSFGHMGGCIDNYSHFFYWAGPNVHDLYRNGKEVHHDGEFFPDLLVRETSQFIDRNRERPFFIYFAINLPHYPYQAETKWLNRYHNLPYPRNLYAAFVSTMDERVGRLLDELQRLELREQTVVIFQSDNGYSVEDRAHLGGGSAGQFRGAKFSLLEGGIRVPALLSWPGKLPQNVVRDDVAFGCDWVPTLAELCGVPLPKARVDGFSLVASNPPPRALHWQTGAGGNISWAVRDGHWKLISNPLENAGDKAFSERLALIDLSKDPTEQSNLAGQFPKTVERLRGLHEAWIKSF